MAIIMPAVSAVKASAQKVRDISNLKKIAEIWRECVINRGWVSNATYAIGFIDFLSGDNVRTNASDIIINDPSIFISPGDKYGSKIPKGIEYMRFFNGQKVV
jgi:hypothetical protein